MSSKNVIKKIKIGIVSVLMLSTGVTPAFASEQYPGHDYPTQLYGMPTFSITRIDLTNNQLEFSLNTDMDALNGKVLSHFGAGWVTDESAVSNMDLLAYDSVSNTWSTRAFWNDADALSKYLSETSGAWEKYTVDAEVDLKTNTSGKMFYIAEFEDGDKWISRISYQDCMGVWYDGMSCDIQGYVGDGANYDHIYYGLVPVEKKQTQNETPVSEPTAGATPVSDPVPNTVSEPTLIPAETKTETEEKTGVELSDVVEEPTVKTIKSVMVLDSDNEEDEEASEEEVDLAPEGPGDTTLEVPTLGKTGTNGFDWLPYFIGGIALGAISTWFLTYMINKRKLPFLR